MAKFLTPGELLKEVWSIFSEAEQILFIVSPYIKLDSSLKKILEKRINDPELEILLIFGKNEQNIGSSLNSGDLRFFEQFKNIGIYYHPQLHAKYYANDFKSVVTSLNLHSFSIANNIETGVLFESGLFTRKDNVEDRRSFEFFEDLIHDCHKIFVNKTEQKKSFFGLIKSEGRTKVLTNNTNNIHQSSRTKPYFKTGYCIRTGEKIPFDMNRPLSKVAYGSWATHANENYKEKYCHYSGELSDGATSMKYPVLKKYYKEAVEFIC